MSLTMSWQEKPFPPIQAWRITVTLSWTRGCITGKIPLWSLWTYQKRWSSAWKAWCRFVTVHRSWLIISWTNIRKIWLRASRQSLMSCMMRFPRNTVWSIHRPIRERLIKTQAIVCFVHWKSLTMRATSKARRICFLREPLKRQRLSQAWIPQAKRWRCH